MANADPTGGERAVPLSIPPAQANYLRRRLAGFKADLEADLQKHPRHPRAGKWRADADAYGRLAAGIDAGAVVPDARVRRLVRAWGEGYDRTEEYERVCFEHAALDGLRSQLEGGQQ